MGSDPATAGKPIPPVWLPRVLLSAMFIESAVDKLLHWHRYAADVAAHHVPFIDAALALATSAELLGSAALLSGTAQLPTLMLPTLLPPTLLRSCLLLLCAYVLGVDLLFFPFWSLPDPDSIAARKEFLKNLAVIGGLLAVIPSSRTPH